MKVFHFLSFHRYIKNERILERGAVLCEEKSILVTIQTIYEQLWDIGSLLFTSSSEIKWEVNADGKFGLLPVNNHSDPQEDIVLFYNYNSQKQQQTPVSLPGKLHGQRSLVGYSSWGCKELDMTKRAHAHVGTHTHTHTHTYTSPLKVAFLKQTLEIWKSCLLRLNKANVSACILFLFFLNFILYNFTILYWFCHISKWICHRYTCVAHPEPSSLLPPHTIPLGHPSAPAPSIQYHALNLD